jgi:hypothetical protein
MVNKAETISNNQPPFEILKFDPTIDKLDNLQHLIEQAYQTNMDFFGQKANGIKISFLYSDQEMKEADESIGLQYQDWHKALAYHDNIWIFSPNLPKGINCQKILKHEIAHIFTNKLFSESRPAWLREGIAEIVSGGNPENQFQSDTPFKKAQSGQDFQQYPIYGKSTVFVRYLIEKYSKDTLFILLGSIKDEIGSENNYDDFCNLFKKIYGIDFETTENQFIKEHNISLSTVI